MTATSFSGRHLTMPIRDTLHGIEIEDPFRWLEDQEAPATRAFLMVEHERYQDYLKRNNDLRSRIRRRVAELLTVETVDLPTPDKKGGLVYLKRGAEEQQKSLYHLDRDGREEFLLSPPLFANNTSIAVIQISPTGRFLVLGGREGGEDVQTILFYDLLRCRLLPDRLPCGFYRGLVFNQDETSIYYSHEDAEGRYQLRRAIREHRLGSDTLLDREVFYAGDGPALRLVIQGPQNGRWLGYLVGSLESRPETHFFVHDLASNGPPRKVGSFKDVVFRPAISDDMVEAMTTLAAMNGRLVRFAIERPEESYWETVLPEMPEQLLFSTRVGPFLAAHYVAEGMTLTRVYDHNGTLLRTIEYPQGGTITIGQIDPTSLRLYYSHSGVNSRLSIHSVELDSGEHRPWWGQGDSATPLLTIERRSYPSIDGTPVPITIYGASIDKGHHPALLSAYGAGIASNTPKFSVLLAVLVEEGFLCATAHVRGGGEHGPAWHEAGLRTRKQTSVEDLIRAAEWLVDEGYADKSRLGVAGQSSGALLTLCALTQRPKLFRAALALGPIADLTRFHLFGVARGFVAEFGSPEDPDEFAALYQLSPYHRIRNEERYPAVLMVSGDRDRRCDALHSRKMVARLQAVESQPHPVLLDYNGLRGHKPVLPLKERIDALTDRLTFLIAELRHSEDACQ